MHRKTKSFFEQFLFSLLMIFAIALSFAGYAQRQNRFKDRQRIMEQILLRQGIRLFHAQENFYPARLEGIFEVLRPLGWDESFRRDPFGKDYRYDPEKGWVE